MPNAKQNSELNTVMSYRISLVGQTFTSWFVFADAPPRIYPYDTHGRSWVRCVCGTERIVTNGGLILGRSRSCGECGSVPSGGDFNRRHGCSRTRIYNVWLNMRRRCEDQGNRSFRNYGARGIRVCSRWNLFEHFLEDMGVGKSGWQLERLNNDGHYEPGNVVWATSKQQTRNYRRNIILTVRGITACLIDLCNHFHVPYKRTWKRFRKFGWSIEDAMFT